MKWATKLIFLLGCLFSLGCSETEAEDPPKMLIAHRGGVVDEQRSENSMAALEEAIERGYTHVEVDARITADGHVVCFHNDDLREEANLEGRISELPFDSVTKIVLTRSQETIPSFEEYVSRCKDRIGVMVDLKGCPDTFITAYAEEILFALQQHNLLEESLILINKTPKNNQDKIIPYFLGKAKVSWRAPLLIAEQAAAKDPNFANNYYVFNHGADFDAAAVKAFQDLGLPVIVSINTGHYRKEEAQAMGIKHVQDMLEYQVDGLQIDAVYDPILFPTQ